MAIFCRDEKWLDELIFPKAKGYMSSWIVLDNQEKKAEWLTNVGENQPKKTTSRSISKSLRFAVLRRDDFSCIYCGRRPPEVILHVDHVKPWSKGGPTELSNLRTACSTCNIGKGATSL
jgi:5-methylcytosine-specific restriction endonuclease McrA